MSKYLKYYKSKIFIHTARIPQVYFLHFPICVSSARCVCVCVYLMWSSSFSSLLYILILTVFSMMLGSVLTSLLFKILFILFLERGVVGEREGEKHLCVRETSVGCLLRGPQPWTWPVSQACVLTGVDPAAVWCTGRRSNQLSPPARALFIIFKRYYLFR